MNRHHHVLLGVAVAFAAASLAGCAPRPAPPQPPAPAPVGPAPAPAPPPPAPPPADWRDAPLSAGDWTWSGEGAASRAMFGAGGAPAFALRCDSPGRVTLIRNGAAGSTITVRTSSNERRLTATARGGDVVATLAASDPLLDQIAFSRGRILVETEGAPPLIVPAWPEPARVTEDCRQ